MKTHANKLNKAMLIRPAAGKRPTLCRSFGDGERITRILPPARYERRMQRLNHKLEFIRYYVLACTRKSQRTQKADT